KLAVERNLEVVPRSTLDQVMVEDGDELEIVHFVGGGDHPVAAGGGDHGRRVDDDS
ncbi:sulfur carrier protein ThiS, partial [Escherichia coli]|nr:sulfur carrier protein ThiS [Escherichia coli]